MSCYSSDRKLIQLVVEMGTELWGEGGMVLRASGLGTGRMAMPPTIRGPRWIKMWGK